MSPSFFRDERARGVNPWTPLDVATERIELVLRALTAVDRWVTAHGHAGAPEFDALPPREPPSPRLEPRARRDPA